MCVAHETALPDTTILMIEENANLLRKEFTINNKLGLHARPAAMFVKLANTFDSEIWVSQEDEQVNGKSIMGLMMLAAPGGSAISVSAEGADATAAVDALGELVEGGFKEN